MTRCQLLIDDILIQIGGVCCEKGPRGRHLEQRGTILMRAGNPKGGRCRGEKSIMVLLNAEVGEDVVAKSGTNKTRRTGYRMEIGEQLLLGRKQLKTLQEGRKPRPSGGKRPHKKKEGKR